jgi:hypothetical protein
MVSASPVFLLFLMLSILGLLLQTRPINATEIQGKGDYSIADSHGVAVFEHRYDAVLDASTSIIMIEMPFLRLRSEMGKLRTAMERASKEYDHERDLNAGGWEEDHNQAGGGQLHGMAGGETRGENLQGGDKRRRLPDEGKGTAGKE